MVGSCKSPQHTEPSTHASQGCEVAIDDAIKTSKSRCFQPQPLPNAGSLADTQEAQPQAQQASQSHPYISNVFPGFHLFSAHDPYSSGLTLPPMFSLDLYPLLLLWAVGLCLLNHSLPAAPPNLPASHHHPTPSFLSQSHFCRSRQPLASVSIPLTHPCLSERAVF